MANEIAGTAGEVMAPGDITGIKSWTMTYEIDALDVTSFVHAGVGAFIPGVSRWSGSFEGFKTGVPIAGLHTEIFLHLLESHTGGQLWEGQAILTSVTPSTDHDGIVSYAYTFQGTGPLTVAAA